MESERRAKIIPVEGADRSNTRAHSDTESVLRKKEPVSTFYIQMTTIIQQKSTVEDHISLAAGVTELEFLTE